jgi:predicted RNA-binding protein with RPS1 domain
MSLSRVSPAVRTADLCMCEEPAAAEEPVAEAPVEAAEAAEPKKRPPRAKGPPKKPLEEFEVGATVEGKIRSVMAYGAFVDIGATTDGLLHVSEINNKFVKDANDELTAGETVSVRIKAINLEKQQLALTGKDESEAARPARRPKADLTEYESADAQVFVSGTVSSITDYGAFVSLKEGVDGLLHISAIKEGGVGKVSDELSVGQEVQVRVVSFDKGKRRIGLSMKPWVEGEDQPKKRGRRDRDDGPSEDAAFQLSEAELAELNADDAEEPSTFEAAFARAAAVQQAKADGKKYSATIV